MASKLYMVSLGPSDYELVTIKALRALQASRAICVPTKSPDRSFSRSISYRIIQELMAAFGFEKPIIAVYAPMHFKEEDWRAQVDILKESVAAYGTVSFVTLGDAAVYSSVYYLLDILQQEAPALYAQSEVIAGVTSFSHASARIKKPLCLGDNRFEVIPLLGREVPSTKVYMRPQVGMPTGGIAQNGEIYTFENLNFQDEQIHTGKLPAIRKYMTLMIDFIKGGVHGV